MSNEIDRRIGERVARARADKGLTQAAVADAMRDANDEHRWSQTTVWSIERGDRSLKANEIGDLSRIIGGGLMMLIDFDPTVDHLYAVIQAKRKVAAAGTALHEACADIATRVESLQKIVSSRRVLTAKRLEDDRWARLDRDLDEADLIADRAYKLLAHIAELTGDAPDVWHYLTGRGHE